MTDTHSALPASIPDVRPRPALDRWLRDRDIDYAGGGRLFGVSKQTCHDWCRHFDDEARKAPGRAALTRIVRETHGAIRPGDFSPPVEQILRGMAA